MKRIELDDDNTQFVLRQYEKRQAQIKEIKALAKELELRGFDIKMSHSGGEILVSSGNLKHWDDIKYARFVRWIGEDIPLTVGKIYPIKKIGANEDGSLCLFTESNDKGFNTFGLHLSCWRPSNEDQYIDQLNVVNN